MIKGFEVCFYSAVCGKSRNLLKAYVLNWFSSATGVVPSPAMEVTENSSLCRAKNYTCNM